MKRIVALLKVGGRLMGGIFRLLSNGHAIIEISPNSISFVSFLCFRKSLVDLWAFDEKELGCFASGHGFRNTWEATQWKSFPSRGQPLVHSPQKTSATCLAA